MHDDCYISYYDDERLHMMLAEKCAKLLKKFAYRYHKILRRYFGILVVGRDEF